MQPASRPVELFISCAEQERARADIEALEELFGPPQVQPPPVQGAAPAQVQRGG